MTHKKISFVKSAVRIVGYFMGLVAFHHTLLGGAFYVLILSEMVGIIEELGEK